jgi:hypothetical protein
MHTRFMLRKDRRPKLAYLGLANPAQLSHHLTRSSNLFLERIDRVPSRDKSRFRATILTDNILLAEFPSTEPHASKLSGEKIRSFGRRCRWLDKASLLPQEENREASRLKWRVE